MSKSNTWEHAREWILSSITTGALSAGDPLPSQPELQEATGVGRHSLRRAMTELAAEGHIRIEQGRGTFVSTPPQVIYRIGRRTRFRDMLRSQGVTPSSDHIKAEILPAPEHIARMLGIEIGAPVHSYMFRGKADGVPISIGIGWHSATRFPDMGERRMAGESVTAIYRSYGIEDYNRRETMLSARMPDKLEARMLQQPVDRPVDAQEKDDVTLTGVPLSWSESIWSAGRVRFLLDGGYNEASQS